MVRCLIDSPSRPAGQNPLKSPSSPGTVGTTADNSQEGEVIHTKHGQRVQQVVGVGGKSNQEVKWSSSITVTKREETKGQRWSCVCRQPPTTDPGSALGAEPTDSPRRRGLERVSSAPPDVGLTGSGPLCFFRDPYLLLVCWRMQVAQT